MRTRFYLVITAVAAPLCCAALVVTAPAQHEGHAGQKSPPQAPPQQVMRMDTAPDHLLAMAYLQNMNIFAKLLRDQVQRDNAVNGAFARDITAELRRSFDQVERYHQRHMDMMRRGMNSRMSETQADAPVEFDALREIGAKRGAITPPSPAAQKCANSQPCGQTMDQMMEMMRRMEAGLMQLSAHLIELERETGAPTPNPKWTLQHTNEILRVLDEVMKMHGDNNRR